MTHLWLGGLSALLVGLAAFSLWAALKARTHRMDVDRRLGVIGRDMFDHADGLAHRCDALGLRLEALHAATDRLALHLGHVTDRARLLELERELARIAAGGRLEAAASARLEDAIATLRAEIANKDA
jgi:hypothetical protein